MTLLLGVKPDVPPGHSLVPTANELGVFGPLCHRSSHGVPEDEGYSRGLNGH